jgi:hypothetical protein
MTDQLIDVRRKTRHSWKRVSFVSHPLWAMRGAQVCTRCGDWMRLVHGGPRKGLRYSYQTRGLRAFMPGSWQVLESLPACDRNLGLPPP